jgi:signal transduction histidine kinase
VASRTGGTAGRTWSDALLGRPRLLVAAVVLFVALPVLLLGAASENDARSRLRDAELESAAHAGDVIASALTGRMQLFRDTTQALALRPRPEDSPIAVAAQHADVAALQSYTDVIQQPNARYVTRAYILVRGSQPTILDARIVAISPSDAALSGHALSDLKGANVDAIRQFIATSAATTAGENNYSDPYSDPAGPVSGVASIATIEPRDPPFPGAPASARSGLSLESIVVELDVPRLFADTAEPALGTNDDAYLLDISNRLLARVRGVTDRPLRDLSTDGFVVLAKTADHVARAGVADPLGGGTRLIASRPFQFGVVARATMRILVVRDTSAVDREIDTVLGQLATARYALVALLLLGAVVVARAAGAQIRQRRALAMANERIEAASLHKSAFLSSMSHELRTPLNSINGFSDVLLTGIGGTLTEKQREYLTDIRGSGEHLLALVNDVLDLSKVEAGKMELQPVEFDLREAIESVHRVVAPLAQQKGQRLELNVGEGGTVRLDQGRFRQVLLNVLSNAVKYTPNGGSVTTDVRRSDGSVEIAVRDTGVGIAMADQARVFEDFTRIESGYARTQQGTGLGLALARRLVRLMGGDITLDSEPGRGSTFTITIPAA